MSGSSRGKSVSDRAPSQRIRTVFCTSGGVLGALVLRTLLSDPSFEVVGLVCSNRVFRAEFGFLRGALSFFRRCGVFYTVYIWLITTAAEVLGSLLRSAGSSVGMLAGSRGIPRLVTRDLNSSEGREFLGSLSPDLLITAHFDQKLGPGLCDGETYAAVNLHPSLLPMHRGVEPVVQSLIGDESQTGISLHRLSEEIDRGRILQSVAVKKTPGQSVFSLSCDLMKEGSRLLLAHKELLLDRTSGKVQGPGGSYESWPSPRDIRSLYRKGGALIRIPEILGLLRIR